MATHITVAVGANGEALAAKGMRDSARADRLDKEATAKQAKKAAIEKLDDDTNGRENKLGKYGPSRDPAAFARKKQDGYGDFVGINIFYQYFPLIDDWNKYYDLAFLILSVRGCVVEDGSASLAPPVEIELRRNIRTETFALPAPEGFEYKQVLWNSANWGAWGAFTSWPWLSFGVRNYWNFFGEFYGEIGSDKYAIQAAGVNEDGDKIWLNGSGMVEDVGRNVMKPLDDTTSFRVYNDFKRPWTTPTGYFSDPLNGNLRVNGRTEEDNTITGFSNYRQDPVQEVFLLPFTKEKAFLVTILTDYMIATRGWWSQTAQAESVDKGQYPESSEWHPYHTTEVSYWRQKPVYEFPDGYEYPDIDLMDDLNAFPYPEIDPVITKAGANKIQEVKLFTIENGTIEEVESVPQELRDRASGLSSNLEGRTIPTISRDDTFKEYASAVVQAYFTGRGVDYQYQSGDDLSNWFKWEAACSLDRYDFSTVGRKYLKDETRQRSIAKGYGIGKLSTDNHFDSPYIDSTSKGFWDDRYFTPMVYSYLKGIARPGMTYEQAKLGRPLDPDTGSPVEVNLFVDHNGYDKVRFTNKQPAALNVAETITSDWQTEPAFEYSTHQCWNWNRPDICWDELKSLGFGPDLIGERPAKP